MPATNAIPAEYFPAIDGSMSSSDGQSFYLKVARDDSSDVMLGFPHVEIPDIIELAAMQLAHGEIVLSSTVGQAGRIPTHCPAIEHEK